MVEGRCGAFSAGRSSDAELRRACNEVVSCADAVALAEAVLVDAGIESARFEAQLLTALALQADRTAVIARTAPNPDERQKAELFRLLSERAGRVPLAYLRGTQEFYGLTFDVSSATLIPRPETELLVELAIRVLSAESATCDPVMIDIGCGSGCISIAALNCCEQLQALAIDISASAIAVARANAKRLGVSNRIRFVQGNVLTGIRKPAQLIVSNPPYIKSAEIANLQPEVADHEPKIALDGGADGLVVIREIVNSAAALLDTGGWLALECAQGQAPRLSELFCRAGLSTIHTVTDLSGIERVVCGMQAH